MAAVSQHNSSHCLQKAISDISSLTWTWPALKQFATIPVGEEPNTGSNSVLEIPTVKGKA